ncbi:MAG: tRNA (N(6)-L-threonylcarbamoyladenosine(37)-C(2))-methylthiotransferase MtaB [Gammaproteobacteria bacterium]
MAVFIESSISFRERVPVTRIAYCTFGCRLNQYDTETIRTLVARERGYETVDQRELADIYVVNTCTVTARADANARKMIRRLHSQHPQARIVVAGCYAQRAPKELAALPGVSLIVGAAERARIGEELQGLISGGQRIRVSPITEAKSFLDIPIGEMSERSRAIVKIQEGCNRRCTFCIIPKTRGRSRSRRPERVLHEVQGLVTQGYREIVLTGVHLGDYGLDLGHDRRLLTQLLRDILDIPGMFRLRLSSIEPTSVSDELIELLASEKRFARHFHIPVQSAANAVLKRMKRGYSADEFATLINRIVRQIPDCGIGTDVICGFPGETEADFRQTFERLSALPITYIHPFPYSLRPGSEAEPDGDDVAPSEKKRRTHVLKRLSRSKNRIFREAQLGKVVGVLFELPKGKADGTRAGWTDNYLRVRLDSASVPAGIEQVRIHDLAEDGLIGEPLGVATQYGR